jgi:hypothetical protein
MWSLFEIVSVRAVQRHDSSNGQCRERSHVNGADPRSWDKVLRE